MKSTQTFDISHSCLLDATGQLTDSCPTSISAEHLRQAYATMVLIRAFDQKAIALQRTGKLGTYPSILGQEAISTAIGMTMQADDVFVPYYRDQAAQYLRGVSLTEILLYWGGDERGSNYASPKCAQDMPVCVPIATQYCHAAGIATAMKIRAEKRAVVVTCGDGATSKGDFLESLNLAGTWHLPMVMVVNNNQWAISTPRAKQCNAQTLAQKAIGAGVQGLVVDGNDYVGMAYELQKALSRAHAGKGPTLIEATSYRLGDHTTADDASRYRPAQELKAAWEKEPIKRLRHYLQTTGLWTDADEQALLLQVKADIDQVVADYTSIAADAPESMFTYLFEELPSARLNQYQQVANAAASHAVKGGSHHE